MPSASTCIRRTLARPARPNSGFTRSTRGRETPFYTDRERAALAWTEALTLIREGRAPDDVYEVKAQFTDEDLVTLTLAVVAINGWNRIAIGFRAVPGSCQPSAARSESA